MMLHKKGKYTFFAFCTAIYNLDNSFFLLFFIIILSKKIEVTKILYQSSPTLNW